MLVMSGRNILANLKIINLFNSKSAEFLKTFFCQDVILLID